MQQKINELLNLMNEIHEKAKFRRKVLELSKQGLVLVDELKALADEGE